MNEQLEKFDSAWNSFMERLKDKMIDASSSTLLDPFKTDVFLKNAISDWDYDFRPWGKWLSDYRKEEPDKSQQIKDVVGSMRFDILSEEDTYHERKGGWITFLCIAILYTLVKQALHARYLGFILACVVGGIAALIGEGIRYIVYNKESKSYKTKLVGAYLQQLEKYKKEIAEIICPDKAKETITQ